MTFEDVREALVTALQRDRAGAARAKADRDLREGAHVVVLPPPPAPPPGSDPAGP